MERYRLSSYLQTLNRNVGYPFLRWIFPPECLLCQSNDMEVLNQVCPKCWASLPRNTDAEMSGLWLSREKIETIHIAQFFAFFQFDGGIQHIIHELKYSGRTRVAKEIVQSLTGDLSTTFQKIEFDELIPVPLHSKKLRERGFNQSELIAVELSTVLDRPMRSDLLKRVRHTESQTLLTAEERLRNVSNAFEVSSIENAKNKTLLLVDDLITTGSTFNECAETLLNAGANNVYALAVARA